jgi:hypothetical protein
MEEELYRCVLERNNGVRCIGDGHVSAMLPVHLKDAYDFCTDLVYLETECYSYLEDLLLSGEDVRRVQLLCAQVNNVFDRHRLCLCGYEDADFFVDTYAQAVKRPGLGAGTLQAAVLSPVSSPAILFVVPTTASSLLTAQVRIWCNVLGKSSREELEVHVNKLSPSKRACILQHLALLQ